MASADFSRQALLRVPKKKHVRETSPVINDNFHPMCSLTLLYMDSDSYRTSLCHASSSSIIQPCSQFLFVEPGLCLQLPSDSTSRWTPLPLANDSHYQGSFGTRTLELSPVPGEHEKRDEEFRLSLMHNQI